MLLRALQVCQHFIAGRGLAFHGNWGPKAVVLPQAILLGLIHLCQDLITRFVAMALDQSPIELLTCTSVPAAVALLVS